MRIKGTSLTLAWAACGVTLVILAPVAVLILKAVQVDSALWSRLWSTRIPLLLWNSCRLSLAVSGLTLLMGLSSAWIVTRYAFKGQRFWQWLLAAPLAIPPYILAFIYTDLSGNYNSFLLTTWVLSLATYPYVYLLTRASLVNFNTAYEDNARLLGLSGFQVFRRVTFPLLRPAIAASVFVVGLYCLADFGAVSIMRYSTFTRMIYLEMNQSGDLMGAAALSSILMVLCFSVFLAERFFRKRMLFHQTSGCSSAIRKPLNPLATLSVWSLFSLWTGGSIGLVLVRLSSQSWEVLKTEGFDPAIWDALGKTVFLSFLAASCAVVCAWVVVWGAYRLKQGRRREFLKLAYVGYALPGPLVGVALILVFLNIAPLKFLYGTFIVIVLAYVIRFLALALQSVETSLTQMSTELEEAARLAGVRGFMLFRRVLYPLVKPGLIVAWVFVFLNSMRELPATLMLRPVAFDTLAVRVWMETNNEFYTLASPAALVLVLASLPLVGFVLTRRLKFAGSAE